MNCLERLKEFYKDGYCFGPIIDNPGIDYLKQLGFPDWIVQQNPPIIAMFQGIEQKNRIFYPLVDKTSIEFAKEKFEEHSTPTHYEVKIQFYLVGETSLSTKLELSNLMASIGQILNPAATIIPGYTDTSFSLKATEQFKSKEDLAEYDNQVSKVASMVAVINNVGVKHRIVKTSFFKYHFGYSTDMSEMKAFALTEDVKNKLEFIHENVLSLHTFNDIFSASSIYDKLILIQAFFETQFYNPKQTRHLLSDEEIAHVLEIVEENISLPKNKMEGLINLIGNPANLPKMGKRSIIAENIVTELGGDIKEVKRNLNSLAALRNNRAHELIGKDYATAFKLVLFFNDVMGSYFNKILENYSEQ